MEPQPENQYGQPVPPEPQQPNSVPATPMEQPPAAPVQPIQQPVATPPSVAVQPHQMPQQSVAAAEPAGFVFSSNPFRSFVTGLSDLLKRNPISALTLGLLTAAVIIVTTIVAAIFMAIASAADATVLGTIIYVLLMLAMIVFTLRGVGAATLLHLQQGELSARDAFVKQDTNDFLRFVGSSLLTVLLVGLGMLLFIVPGLIIAARLLLVPFVVYDEKLGAIAAMKRSWQLTKGHTWEMLGVMMASSITLGNGGLLGYVGMLSGTANRYTELKQAEAMGQPTGKTHWMNYVVLGASMVLLVGILLLGVISSYVGIQNRARQLQEAAESREKMMQEMRQFDFKYNYTPSPEYRTN